MQKSRHLARGKLYFFKTMAKPVRLFEQQTGEGKTLIIAVIAACKANLEKVKVDIISSNHDLVIQ